MSLWRKQKNKCSFCGEEALISDVSCPVCGLVQSDEIGSIIDKRLKKAGFGATLDKNYRESSPVFTEQQLAHMKSSVKQILKKEILDLLRTKDCTIPEMRLALGEREELITECVGELLDSNEIQSNMSVLVSEGKMNHWAEYGLVKHTKIKKDILKLLEIKNYTIPDLNTTLDESEELIQECIGELERTDKIELKGFYTPPTGGATHWAEYGLKNNTITQRPEKKAQKKEETPEELNPILRRMRAISL